MQSDGILTQYQTKMLSMCYKHGWGEEVAQDISQAQIQNAANCFARFVEANKLVKKGFTTQNQEDSQKTHLLTKD